MNKPQSDAAQERLEAALRANLARRKAQARARETAEPQPAETQAPDSFKE